MTAKGSYVLVVRLEEAASITVGKLGPQAFPKGYYLYFGSALNGLEGRIQRHVRTEFSSVTSTASLLWPLS